jgi:hypothetical protein
MDKTYLEYNGIKAGEMLREIETGKTGEVQYFYDAPDGVIVVCDRFAAYIHNTEFA